jgi:hypothetical protein
MKKQILLLSALFASLFGMAQVAPSIGIRGGLTSAGVRGDAMANLNSLLDFTGGMLKTGNRTGFFVGPYVTLPVSEKFAIEPGLYYSQKGAALKGGLAVKAVELLGVNAHAQLNANYIDVPVLAKATFGGFQVFAGPQVSYLVQSNLKTTAGVLGINLLNKSWNVTDQFNRWDAGITGGIGYQFANGVNITAAYDHGLMRTDANKSMNSYNHAVKIGLGIRL